MYYNVLQYSQTHAHIYVDILEVMYSKVYLIFGTNTASKCKNTNTESITGFIITYQVNLLKLSTGSFEEYDSNPNTSKFSNHNLVFST